MFELYQLAQLVAFADCGTLAAAAEQLHLSQPALSRSMQRLEADMQVSLFDRQKNRIELNANGQLAVEHARKLLWQAQDMVSAVQSFDRQQRTILVGSCAPAPLWEILPALYHLYPDMTVSSEMRADDVLLHGLREGTYQLIVLPRAVQEDGLTCQHYEEEHLYFSLPPAHPLSGSSGLHLRDLNGETMLLSSNIGFWRQLVDEKMADTHFLVQEEAFAFNELVKSSALPSFTTDLALQREERPQGRIQIPILDPEANVTYYIVYQNKNRRLLAPLLQRLIKAAEQA